MTIVIFDQTLITQGRGYKAHTGTSIILLAMMIMGMMLIAMMLMAMMIRVMVIMAMVMAKTMLQMIIVLTIVK